MLKLALIGLGGGIGSLARYGLAGVVQRLSDADFPLGTMAVNVLGCLVIGLLGAFFAGPHLVREDVRLMILIGVLGGFTTFSSFGYETFALVNDGQYLRAAVNVLLTNALCLAAVWSSYRLGETWFGP